LRDNSGLEFTAFYTNWGWCGLARSRRGLTTLVLPRPTAEEVFIALNAIPFRQVADQHFKEIEKKLQGYFSGERTHFNEAIDLTQGTEFQRRVWLAAKEIPYGEARSYAWVAVRVGNPRAYRAVGQALGKNPLPIVIPCHRVLTSRGSIGGFSAGLENKERLLELEGISCLVA